MKIDLLSRKWVSQNNITYESVEDH